MPIVVDASIALATVLEEEVGRQLSSALVELERSQWVVPAIWWFEIRNGLIVNERRRRISEPISADFLRQLANVPTRVDSDPDSDNLMALGRKHRLTAYDAAYLELAVRLGLPLATLDGSLAGAARAEAVPLIGVDAA